eukprot:scaffold2127_cov118-Skeletonema_marinoi.AAC.3
MKSICTNSYVNCRERKRAAKLQFCGPFAFSTGPERCWAARYFVTPDVITRAQCATKQRSGPDKTTLVCRSIFQQSHTKVLGYLLLSDGWLEMCLGR